jgi:hypothetical protein
MFADLAISLQADLAVKGAHLFDVFILSGQRRNTFADIAETDHGVPDRVFVAECCEASAPGDHDE